MCGFPTTCLEIQLLALVGLDVVVPQRVLESSDGIIDGDGPKECDDPRGFEKLKVIKYGFWRSKILSWYPFHAMMDCLS